MEVLQRSLRAVAIGWELYGDLKVQVDILFAMNL